jgi:hypothetical protein
LSYEELADKLLKQVKKIFLPTELYGKLKSALWDRESKSLIYTFKEIEIRVRVRPTCNLNNGTWYQIDSVRVNGAFVVADENSYGIENGLLESK